MRFWRGSGREVEGALYMNVSLSEQTETST